MIHSSAQTIPSFTYTQAESHDWELLLTNDDNIQTINSPHQQQSSTQQSTFIRRILPDSAPAHDDLTFEQKKNFIIDHIH